MINFNIPVAEKISSDSCCGCEACANVCPKNIIAFEQDEEGFRFPTMDADKCIHCNACVNVCPQLHEPQSRIELRECYGGYALDDSLVLSSSSGGIFSLLVNEFKKRNEQGIFVGVIWGDNCNTTRYVASSDLNALEQMRGSKYIQARKGNIYQIVKEKLMAGIPVFFTGCPCEVAALKSCLGQLSQSDLLYTADFVCKGATSERIMTEYLDMVSPDSLAVSANLRVVGKQPWIPQWMKIVFENGKVIYMPFYLSSLGQAFQILQREACYTCQYCGENRFSDVTMGDFHGFDEKEKYYNPNGTSILIANTEKGMKMINNIKTFSCLHPVNYAEISRKNQRLENAWGHDSRREVFVQALNSGGLRKAWKTIMPIHRRIEFKLKELYYERTLRRNAKK